MPQIDIALVKEFVELENQRNGLDDQLKGVNNRRKEIKAILLEQFTNANIQNMSVDGRTVYMTRQLWVSGDANAHEKMREYGLDWMIQPKVNTQTLSAEIRDWEDEGKEIPDDLREVLRISERFDVRSRRT